MKKYLTLLFYFILVNIFFIAAYFHISRYYGIAANTFDLGYFHNLIVNSFNGDYFFTSFFQWNEMPAEKFNCFGDHLFIILILFFPFIIVSNSALFLSFLHIFIMIVCAAVLFEFAKQILKNHISSFFITLLFLANNYFLYILAGDFHIEYYWILILLLVFYFAQKKKYRLSYLFCALLLMVKETMLLTTALVLFFMYLKSKRKMYLLLATVSFFYFFIAVKLVMPQFRNDGAVLKPEYFSRYSEVIETNDKNVFFSLISRPLVILKKIASVENREYLIEFSKKKLFMPVFSLFSYTAAPTFLINALTNLKEQRTIYYQYNADLFIIFFISFIFVIVFLNKIIKQKYFVYFIILFALALNIFFLIDNNPFTAPESYFKDKQPLNNSLAISRSFKLIPLNSSVGIDERIGVYFTHKKNIEYLDFSRNYFPAADYLLFNYENTQSSEYYEYYNRLLNSDIYSELFSNGNFYILKKNE